MTRTHLHELAVTTAKASLAETNPITLSNITVKAAQDYKVAPEDWNDFQRYFQSARSNYQSLARQPLPSEQAAARAKQQEEAKAARQSTAPVPKPAETK